MTFSNRFDFCIQHNHRGKGVKGTQAKVEAEGRIRLRLMLRQGRRRPLVGSGACPIRPSTNIPLVGIGLPPDPPSRHGREAVPYTSGGGSIHRDRLPTAPVRFRPPAAPRRPPLDTDPDTRPRKAQPLLFAAPLREIGFCLFCCGFAAPGIYRIAFTALLQSRSFLSSQAMLRPKVFIVSMPSASWAASPFSRPKPMFQ